MVKIQTRVRQINQKSDSTEQGLFSTLDASPFDYGEKTLSFRIKKNDKDIKDIVIKYDEGRNFCDVEFWGFVSIGNFLHVQKIKVEKGVFGEGLSEIIRSTVQ